METFSNNLKYAVRMVMKSPGLAAVAILTLAIGIGANAAIFSIVYGTLLEPLPYPHSEELVMVWSQLKGDRGRTSPADYRDWQRENSVFQSLLAWTGKSFNLSKGANPEMVDANLTVPGWWTKLLQEPMFLGRDFLPDEDQPGKGNEVILTHKFWVRRFGGDQNIIGRQIRLDGESYAVVGVFPEGIEDRGNEELAVPLAFEPRDIQYTKHFLYVMGRLRTGVSVAQAQANMNIVQLQIAAAHPDEEKGRSISVEPLHDDFLPRTTRSELWLFLGAVGFVFLLACANVANLMLARVATLQKEIAIRVALGAGRLQILLRFLTEGLCLALMGALAGIFVAEGVLKGILSIIPVYTLPYEADIRLKLPVLLFMLGISTLAAMLFSAAPAWHALHVSLNELLKEGNRSSSASGGYHFQRTLVVMEVALSLCLLSGASLAIRSFSNLMNQDLGIRRDHILTFRLAKSIKSFDNNSQIVAFYRGLLANVAATPGVLNASTSGSLPVRSTTFVLPFGIPGQTAAELGANPTVNVEIVSPEYFRTFGISLLRGRTFNDQDIAGSTPVAIVNEAFAKHYFPRRDPLGQEILVAEMGPLSPLNHVGPMSSRQIVGIFHDVRIQGPRQTDVPEIDLPFPQEPWNNEFVAVRTSGDPRSVIKGVSAAVSGVDSSLPLTQVRTMDEVYAQSLAGDRWTVALYIGFGLAAFLLAMIGVYGVMSFSVVQRMREIGIRVALGAHRSHVLLMVIKSALLLAGIGVVIGLSGALTLTHLMAAVLYGVRATDPVSLIGAALLLMFVAVAASYIPAHRATHADPLVVLRNE